MSRGELEENASGGCMHEVESYRRHELDGSIAFRAKLCMARAMVGESLRLRGQVLGAVWGSGCRGKVCAMNGREEIRCRQDAWVDGIHM